MTRHGFFVLALAVLLARPILVGAHSGPPFPILSNRIVGAYDVSIWSDPDATDDGTAAGKFWVVLASAKNGEEIPVGTRAHVTIQAVDRQAPALDAAAEPTDGLVTRQFAALLMDHEGPYRVSVVVDGPLGRAEVDTNVDATYDLRPPIGELIIFLFPFTALAALWVIMLKRRRTARPRPAGPQTVEPVDGSPG